MFDGRWAQERPEYPIDKRFGFFAIHTQLLFIHNLLSIRSGQCEQFAIQLQWPMLTICHPYAMALHAQLLSVRNGQCPTSRSIQ